jgi:hypothetical protein
MVIGPRIDIRYPKNCELYFGEILHNRNVKKEINFVNKVYVKFYCASNDVKSIVIFSTNYWIIFRLLTVFWLLILYPQIAIFILK